MFSVFLHFFRSDLVRNKLFRLRIAVNTICFSSLDKKKAWRLGDGLLPMQPRIDRIFLASSKYGKRPLVMKN